MQAKRWQDWVLLVLGAWLFVSPFWMDGYGGTQNLVAWNSYVFGALIAAVAIWALVQPQRWEEWTNIALGVLLVISPFVLGFYTTANSVAWNDIIVGALVAADAGWALSLQTSQEAHA
jgi:hypothetical protein